MLFFCHKTAQQLNSISFLLSPFKSDVSPPILTDNNFIHTAAAVQRELKLSVQVNYQTCIRVHANCQLGFDSLEKNTIVAMEPMPFAFTFKYNVPSTLYPQAYCFCLWKISFFC